MSKIDGWTWQNLRDLNICLSRLGSLGARESVLQHRHSMRKA